MAYESVRHVPMGFPASYSELMHNATQWESPFRQRGYEMSQSYHTPAGLNTTPHVERGGGVFSNQFQDIVRNATEWESPFRTRQPAATPFQLPSVSGSPGRQQYYGKDQRFNSPSRSRIDDNNNYVGLDDTNRNKSPHRDPRWRGYANAPPLNRTEWEQRLILEGYIRGPERPDNLTNTVDTSVAPPVSQKARDLEKEVSVLEMEVDVESTHIENMLAIDADADRMARALAVANRLGIDVNNIPGGGGGVGGGEQQQPVAPTLNEEDEDALIASIIAEEPLENDLDNIATDAEEEALIASVIKSEADEGQDGDPEAVENNDSIPPGDENPPPSIAGSIPASVISATIEGDGVKEGSIPGSVPPSIPPTGVDSIAASEHTEPAADQ